MQLRTRAVRALLVAGTALSAAAPLSAQQVPTAQQIVDRYVAAIGGERAIAAPRYRHSVMEMSMPAMGMTMTAELYQARPNKAVMRIDIPGMGTMSQGYDGTTAWSVNPMQGAQILTGTQAAEMVRQYDFDSNLRFSQMFASMETVGQTEKNGEACYDVRMTTAEGVTANSCFAVDDGLLVASVVSAETEMGKVTTEVRYSDYQDFGGIKMPSRTEMSMMGQQMVMTVKSVTTEPIADSMFVLPAEIQALKGN